MIHLLHREQVMASSDTGSGIERRGFIATLCMVGGVIVSYGTAAVFGLRYLFGRQLPPRMTQVLVGSLDEIPDGGSILSRDLTGRKFLLVRTGVTVRAFSTACTHLGCQVYWQGDKKVFFCPCHDGYFDADGNPTAGPPPTPLAQYPVEMRGSSVFVSMPEA